MKNYIFKVMPICVVVVALMVSSYSLARPEVGEAAPSFTAKILEGGEIDLISLRGKRVALVFLDSLCPTPHYPNCAEILSSLSKDIKAQPEVTWVGIMNSYYVDEQVARTFLAERGLGLPVVFDYDNTLFKRYGVFATPYLIKLNARGDILTRESYSL